MRRKMLFELFIEDPQTAGEAAENARRALRNLGRAFYNETAFVRFIWHRVLGAK